MQIVQTSVHAMITLYTRKQRGKDPNMYRPLINGILDDPDCTGGVLGVGEGVSEGVGPAPLLQRSPPQQDLQLYLPFSLGP